MKKARQWGFDGLELGYQGDRFDVRRADTYVTTPKALDAIDNRPASALALIQAISFPNS